MTASPQSPQRPHPRIHDHHDPNDPAFGIAQTAHAFDDPRRVRILLALQDGRALSATHLAIEAGVAPSTASAHLKHLCDAGLIRLVPPPPNHGRHRYFTIASPEVAALCESFATFIAPGSIRSLQPGTPEAAMRAGRTCYRHLAGRLAVAFLDALVEGNVLSAHDAGFAITMPGERDLVRFGIDLPALRATKRPLIRHCTDWSEQRHHLSGGLGEALLDQVVQRGWIVRSPADRTVTVTGEGERGFQAWFGLETRTIETLEHTP